MFIVKKKLKSHEYYYLRETRREKGKVISRDIAYLGTSRKEAEEKMREFKNKVEEKGDMGINITYFVHGTTIDNEKEISSGWKDVELSGKGKEQSRELVKQTEDKKFDVIFTSDLKRAVKSAEITWGGKIKIIQDKRLRECNYGDYNGKASSIVEPMQEKSITRRFPNGESYEDVKKRVKDFLNYLFLKYQGKNIAIVSHKAPQLAMDVLLKNKSWEQAFKEDWRKRKEWKPGWEYFINDKIEDNNMADNKDKTEEKQEEKGEKKLTIDELASFCKRKGFVFKSSEIYGGLSGFWDFGHLGVELFNNIKREFWKNFVQEKENMVGIEASIISHPKIWKASGHVANFSDVSVRCKKCKKYNKVDKQELGKAKCSFCSGELDRETAKDLNLMFKTQIGPIEEESMLSYLRPETAQGMFSDFKLVQETSRKQLPFGIVQIGKCFRNEIAPRDFLFRSREFHIGEFEFFIHPDEKKCELLDLEHLNLRLKFLDAETQEKGKEETRETTIGKILKEGRLEEWHAYWLAEQLLWFKKLGLEKIKIREHMKQELSHYSKATFDLDYEYPFGSREIAGNANRGQFDLNQHMKESGEKLDLFDEKTKLRVIPKVIEPTFGIERAFLALLCQAYHFDEKRQNIVLKLPGFLAPVKAAIFPIVKTDDKLVKLSREVYSELRKEWNVNYDESGSVGRRYSRNDEIGTPYCITFDEDSFKQKDCTIRDRDTTKQIRVKISEIKEIMRKLINSEIEFEKAGKIVETRVKE